MSAPLPFRGGAGGGGRWASRDSGDPFPPTPSPEGEGEVSHGARHVAIIMDGNGRWAKRHHLPRAMGHQRGVEAVRRLVRGLGETGLECLTLYAFSSENWKRPEDEIADLMGLMRKFIRSDLPEFVANGVRLKIIGDYKRLEPDIVAMLEDALAKVCAT